MTAHNIYANSAHDLYANSPHGICANSLWLLTSSIQIALTSDARIAHKGQAALWVTNGCTSMSKPITTQSTPMGVDNDACINEVSKGLR